MTEQCTICGENANPLALGKCLPCAAGVSHQRSSNARAIVKATPADAGCYVDGHWGQYATAHMIERATEFGFTDAEAEDLAARKLVEMFPTNGPTLSDNEHEYLTDAADDAEAWLNEHVAPEGYSFGWYEGEFHLQSEAWWEEA